jgi:predicted DNA-binding transcriptional regulator AlpA
MTEKQFIDDCECASIGKFQVQTFRNWRHKGIGPPYVKIGRSVRYDKAELIAWLESHKITPENQNN